jgi:hypothetical protein
MRFTVTTTFDAVGRVLPVVVDEVEAREYPFTNPLDAMAAARRFEADAEDSLEFSSFPLGWLEKLVAN